MLEIDLEKLLEREGARLSLDQRDGVAQFFAAPGRAEIDRPWYHHLAIDTAWAFPVVVGSSLWVAPRLGDLPFSVRTALSMAAVGAVMRLVVFPVRGKVRRRTRLD